MSDQADRLRSAAGALGALRPAVEDGAPWPLSTRFGVEPEASWGPPEVLAHVTEMLPFWIGEIERILASADEPVPFGRMATDPLRLGVIERDRTLPARELFARLESDVARIATRLDELGDAQGSRRGLHPALGELTLAELIERFLASHLEEHAEQLRSILDAPRPNG